MVIAHSDGDAVCKEPPNWNDILENSRFLRTGDMASGKATCYMKVTKIHINQGVEASRNLAKDQT
jgi:hypothetical protein